MTTLTAANREWASRKDDERFTSLTALHAAMVHSRSISMERDSSLKAIQAMPVVNADGSEGLEFVSNKGNPASMTNYAFGQLAYILGKSQNNGAFPPSFVKNLPAKLAADVTNHAISQLTDDEAIQKFFLSAEKPEGANVPSIAIRALNSRSYGRIHNSQITEALVRRFGDGVTGDWKVPGEFGKAVKVTKANTTLFGSDRDMFVFLADETNKLELPNRRNGETGALSRGFFVWNSEVGDNTLGVATFLFDYVCSNRLVWGATEYKEIKFKHSLKAPERFLDEVSPMLSAMVNDKASNTEKVLRLAQETKVGNTDDMTKLFGKLDIVPRTMKTINAAHEKEEGRPMETLWDVSTGITAFAKSIPFQKERVAMERKAGLVIDMVAA